MPFTTLTAQHVVPVSLYRSRHSLHGMEVPGNAVVGIISAQHLVEIAHLFLDRYVPHASHQVASVGESTLAS